MVQTSAPHSRRTWSSDCRDVEKLRSLGYPVEAAPGVAGGYRLSAGGELPPLLLDDAEAVAVAVGLRTAASGSIAGMGGDIDPRSGQARAGPAIASAPQGQRAHRRDIDLRRRRPTDRRRPAGHLAGICRDGVQLHFAYLARDERATKRNTEPSAVVYSGHRWYLVAFDLDRDGWRTFHLDRIQGRVRPGGRGRRRTVPGGDPAAYVKQQLRSTGTRESPARPGRIRLGLAAAHATRRIPARYATIEPDGEQACVVSTRGAWSRDFLVWMALLDEPMDILDPPELAEAARTLVARLSAG